MEYLDTLTGEILKVIYIGYTFFIFNDSRKVNYDQLKSRYKPL